MKKTYDTLVCDAVKRSPLEFVDILIEEAKDAGNFEPLLREAACVIANLLLTEDDWHQRPNGDLSYSAEQAGAPEQQTKLTIEADEMRTNVPILVKPSSPPLEHIIPEKGKTYCNHAGGEYICEEVLHEKNPCVCVLRRLSDDYTLKAHEIFEYPDGTIQWGYSTGGYWPDGYCKKKKLSPR